MARAKPTTAADAAAKNRPLVDDIRLLGRVLGDVIREQEGKAAFELVEREPPDVLSSLEEFQRAKLIGACSKVGETQAEGNQGGARDQP